MTEREARANVRGVEGEDNESASDFSDQVDNMDDELINEEIQKNKGQPKSGKSALDKMGETDASKLESREDDADDTVFIDNLPKDERSLREMVKCVNMNIRELERKFFEEEDSEVEDQLKFDLANEKVSSTEHNKRLESFKERSYIQQFWTIPMSDDVTGFKWD